MKLHFLVFTSRLEHVGQSCLSWTVGVFETLDGAKRASAKYYSQSPRQDPHLSGLFTPRVVIQEWHGHKKLRQWERPDGGAWAEVLPF